MSAPLSLVRRRVLAGLGALAALPGPVRAQAWPTRSIKIVVPFAAGGLTDVMARTVGDLLGPELGQQVIVENRPGASGHIAAEAVARGPADGYHIGMLSAGHAGGSAYAIEPIRYDLLKDFTAIGMLGFSPTLLIANKKLGVASFPQLVQLARERPGQLLFAAVQNYTVEYLESMAGVEFNTILYKGASQAANDMIGGRVDLMLGTVADMTQLLQTGKFNPIALNSPTPLASLPGVGTVASHVPGYRGGQWYGLFVPSGTPEPVVTRLRAALAKVVTDPGYHAALARLSVLAPDLGVTAFATEVASTFESFRRARQNGRPGRSPAGKG